VAVVGGGDSAADEAMTLSKYASRVILFHRRNELRASRALRDQVLANAKIEVRWHSEVLEILGDSEGVVGLTVRDVQVGATTTVDVSAVFVYVGLEANASYLQGTLDLDATGHVITDSCLRTSLEGVFAAGDIRQHSAAQVVSSAGDGASAAVQAYRYVQARSWPLSAGVTSGT
jgi:thioredoxin reductase (NADPH)